LATTSGVERPRYIVIIFQGAVADQTVNSSAYSSDPNVINAYIALSSIKYPSIDMNTDLGNNKYRKWYREYKKFFNNSNSNDISQPCLSYLDFVKVAPMYIFNVSRQSQNLKRAAVDATLFMTFRVAAPANFNSLFYYLF